MDALGPMIVGVVSGCLGGSFLAAYFPKILWLNFQWKLLLGTIGGFLGEQLLNIPYTLEGTGIMTDVIVSTLSGSALIAIIGLLANSVWTLEKIGQELCPECQISDTYGSRALGLRETLATFCHLRFGRCYRRLLLVPVSRRVTTTKGQPCPTRRVNLAQQEVR